MDSAGINDDPMAAEREIYLAEMRREKESGIIPRDPVVEAVRSDLLHRQQLGYRKYGGTLATNPAGLRGALQHAYEEALDLCNYLKWSMMQLDADPALSPDPEHNTGLKDDQRNRLAVQIQTWVENYDPKLLENVSTGALQDELQRRQQAASGKRVAACAHGEDPEICSICKEYDFGL